jgi:hydroxymethylpyrimidine/phosphomethylpyrimidine kinase
VKQPQTKGSPLVIVVGGVDPSGGAGLLRDVATVASRGALAHAVGTAWTVQGAGVHRVEPRAPGAVRAAVAEAIAALRPAAVKIGMAVGPATAAALVEALGDYAGPVVVDPVLATSRGGELWDGEPRALLPLLRRATLVTPNAVEAGQLAHEGRDEQRGEGRGERRDRLATIAALEDAEAAGRRLVERDGLRAVLVKGGHLRGPEATAAETVTDLLITPAGTRRASHARVAGPTPRGTGCALATAIAVELGRGRDLPAAVDAATEWLAGAIATAVDVGAERHLR